MCTTRIDLPSVLNHAGSSSACTLPWPTRRARRVSVAVTAGVHLVELDVGSVAREQEHGHRTTKDGRRPDRWLSEAPTVHGQHERVLGGVRREYLHEVVTLGEHERLRIFASRSAITTICGRIEHPEAANVDPSCCAAVLRPVVGSLHHARRGQASGADESTRRHHESIAPQQREPGRRPLRFSW